MNRRDLLIVAFIVIAITLWWGFVSIYESVLDCDLVILSFFTLLIILAVFMIIITILSFSIKKFGDWGDKKIF